ncbi:hypothetical protein [Reichenbachiella sp.]|uniref:hypothetical protein n=1 Tax=Reichenbachiella sp. TaxID=2184521 RepID=UPI003B5A6477
MNYLFEGDNFGFTQNELHLQGGNSGFKKIAFQEISKIQICKGILTVNPIRTSMLWLVLGFVAFYGIYWAFDEISYAEIDKLNSRTIRGYGGMLACVGLVMIIAVMAFSLLVSNRIVMKVQTINGHIEVRSLKVLEKKNSLPKLLIFLSKKFPPQILQIESKLLKSIELQNI